MDKFHTYEVHIKLVKQDLYELTVSSDGEELPSSEWAPLLLSTHAETFFGTMLLEENNKSESLYLNGWQTVTLFASDHFHPFIEWIWDESCDFMFAISLPIYDAITNKEWQLDYEQINQTFAWALPVSVTEEFHDEFWEEQINGQTARAIATQLFNDGLNFYLSSQTYTASTIGTRLENLKHSPISKEQLQAYFDEDRWQQFLQNEDSALPFTIGIRLVEPNEIHESWELNLFLRDRVKREQTFDWASNRDLPPSYAAYENNILEELARWKRLFPWLVHRNFLTSTLTESEAWHFLSEVSEILLALDVEILLPSWWYNMKQAKFKIRAQVNSNQQTSMVGLAALQDFNWRISINNIEMSEEEFQALVQEKRPFIQIGKRWVALDQEMIKQIQTYMKKAEQQGQHIRHIIEQELQLANSISNEFDSLQVEYELNNYWKEIFNQLRHLNNLPLLSAPATFTGELRPYQQFGFSWLSFLRKYSFGAILADDMGLGKTVQLISYLCHVKENEKPTVPALIICPTSVLGNWQKEIERFAPEMKVHLHYGSNRKKGAEFAKMISSYDVILTSYGLLGLDIDDFQPISWSSVTIDEAQTIKNVGTKQSRAVRSLRGKHHIALSGTPMENRLMELWAIFDFVNRFYLGSVHQFTQNYVLPIERNQDEKAVKNLQTLIKPFLLRRTKKDEAIALNLPDKLEQKEYCPLTVEQATLYEQLVKDTMTTIEKSSSFERVGLVLKMLTKLKQICNHPSLYLKETVYEDIENRSTKIEKVRSIVEEMDLNEESCIIFTQYIEMGSILQQFLKEAFDIDAPFLNGSTSKSDRDQLIEDFQAKKFPIFILSLKAGGTGLNLTAANHVIHFDRWWNPAVENQATDRAYRIGQKRFVHVHKFISTGTLEEKIDAMLTKKQNLNDSIISSDQWMTDLSIEELKELVTLG